MTAEGEFIPVRVESLDVGYIDGMMCATVPSCFDHMHGLVAVAFIATFSVWPVYGSISCCIQSGNAECE